MTLKKALFTLIAVMTLWVSTVPAEAQYHRRYHRHYHRRHCFYRHHRRFCR